MDRECERICEHVELFMYYTCTIYFLSTRKYDWRGTGSILAADQVLDRLVS